MSTHEKEPRYRQVLAASCGSPDVGAPPYAVQVVDVTSVDPATGDASFELAERELTTISDLKKLQGRYFTVLRGGSLTAREIAGSVVFDAEFKDGQNPDLRFDLVDGVIIPLDDSTLSMLSATYQLEQVMLGLESTIGVSADEIISGGNCELLFEPTIRAEGDVDATLTVKDVFDALSVTRAAMQARGDLPLPSASISECELADRDPAESDAPILASFLGAFVESLPESRRASVCVRFEANFVEAFPPSARSACP